jgi:hypothetical protein
VSGNLGDNLLVGDCHGRRAFISHHISARSDDDDDGLYLTCAPPASPAAVTVSDASRERTHTH